MLTETFRLHLCSLHDPWREPGASNQVVRDNSCSHSSWSALLEQTNCSKTQNKPCHSPSPRPLHIPSPMCPVASLLIVGAALCAGPQYSTPKKRQHTFIITTWQRWPSACSCPACTRGFSACDGRSTSLGWPQPRGAQLRWGRLGWGLPPDRVQLWFLDLQTTLAFSFPQHSPTC